MQSIYKYSSPKSFSQFQCSQRLSVYQHSTHSISFVLNVVLMWSRISSNNVLFSDLQPCCSMASMCSRRRLFLQLVIQECFVQQLVSRYVSAGSQCHNENAEVVRNKWNHNGSFSAIKFSVVRKLVIKCGEKPQCLRNPDFVRFSRKISRNPDDIKKPRSSGKPQKPIAGACSVKPIANKGPVHISGSNWVRKLKFSTWIDMIRSFNSVEIFFR